MGDLAALAVIWLSVLVTVALVTILLIGVGSSD